MNETLTTLIAFVGFLIIFSMMIQSVQEALKNLFKIKFGVWERFFLNLYKEEFKIDPGRAETPFLKRRKEKPFIGDFENRLAGMKKMVIKADRQIKRLKPLLVSLSNADANDPKSTSTVLTNLERAQDLVAEIRGMKLHAMLDIFLGNQKKVLEKLTDSLLSLTPGRKNEIDKCKIQKIVEKCEQNLIRLTEIQKLISDYRLQIENKADAWMAQINGEYKKNMLKWTFFISIAAVLFLNADSIKIYQYFSSNRAAAQMVTQASQKDVQLIQTTAEDINAVHKAITEQATDMADTMKHLADRLENDYKTLNPNNGKLTTAKFTVIRTEIDALPKSSQADPNSKPADKTSDSINLVYQKLMKEYLALQQEAIKLNVALLESTGLPIGWPMSLTTIKSIWDTHSLPQLFILFIQKLVGLFLTICLVSFGAPFWKDLLNSLVGLKKLTVKQPGAR